VDHRGGKVPGKGREAIKQDGGIDGMAASKIAARKGSTVAGISGNFIRCDEGDELFSGGKRNGLSGPSKRGLWIRKQ